MSVSRSVKRFAAGRRRNSRSQLMFRADVERADAAAVDNGDVGSDDLSKTII